MNYRRKQMARIIELTHLIHNEPRTWTRPRLAEHFEVNKTTIQRDINILNDMGMEIIPCGKQGYEIKSNFFLPPLNFAFKEALALVTAASLYQGTVGGKSEAALNSAIGKIMSNLQSPTREALNKFIPLNEIPHKKVSIFEENKQFRDEIDDAIRERHSVNIEYNSFYSGRITRHKVSPYGVIFRNNAWYLIGRSETKKEIRTFRINRIESLQKTQREYIIPKDFSLQEYLEKSWDLILGTDTDIVIHFTKEIAPWIKEVNWHPSQQIITNTDGSIRFEVTVSGWEEIGWWVLGWGYNAKVLQPTELRNWIADIASKMVEMYQND